MKEYDRVKLIVEKEKYAQEGVHKGMEGWICDPRNINGQWLVCFDQYGALPNIATIPVKEMDLELVYEHPLMQVGTNVLLLTDEYENAGLRKGLNGMVIGRTVNKWLVRFSVQDGLNETVDYEIAESSIVDASWV